MTQFFRGPQHSGSLGSTVARGVLTPRGHGLTALFAQDLYDLGDVQQFVIKVEDVCNLNPLPHR